MSSRNITVPIEALNTDLFVRASLDQDHAIMLGELIAGGTKLPPIKVTADLKVVDGRHRIEAHLLNGLTEIEAEVVEPKDEKEMVSIAFRANQMGPKPPTTRDIEHTVRLFIELGVAKKNIPELMDLPAGMIRNYVNSVQSKMTRAKLSLAAAAVTDGNLTVAKAAEQFEVEVARLKELLGINRRSKSKQGLAEIQGQLTRLYKSAASKNAALMRSVLDRFEEGEATEAQVENVFTHICKLQRAQARAIDGWLARFRANDGHSSQAQ